MARIGVVRLGRDADVIGREIFGCANQAEYQGASSLKYVAGNADEQRGRFNFGERYTMLARHRTFAQRSFVKTSFRPTSRSSTKVYKSSGLRDLKMSRLSFHQLTLLIAALRLIRRWPVSQMSACRHTARPCSAEG